MPIVPLLKEWSEREPEKCNYVGGMFAIRGWTLTHEYEISERLVNAEIQCAVQEAIESRGWHWYLGRVTIEDGVYYKSRIAVPFTGDKKDAPKLNVFLSTHSPTHVLLQAYVQALEVADQFPGRETEARSEEEEGIESADENAVTESSSTKEMELVA